MFISSPLLDLSVIQVIHVNAEDNLPVVTQGLAEPDSSRVVLVLVGAIVLGILAISTQVFSLFGDFSPFSNLVGSGAIWWFMLGIFIGFGGLIASTVGEVLRE